MGNIAFKERGKHLLTESLIVTKEMNVRDLYDFVGVIGVGSISNIFKIRRKQEVWEMTKEIHEIHEEDSSCDSSSVTNSHHQVYYALKEIDLAKLDPQSLREFRNEIEVLRRLDHPNIIRAYETYNYTSKDGNSMTGIVLELCEGGDLYSRSPYTEQQAGAILYKLIEAINYMHKHNFIHRDIKMENIMFESKEPDADIKLIDFGIGSKFEKNQNFQQMVGTVYSMAPQVFMGHYTQAADMWSVGVVAFFLLSGEKPFWAQQWSKLGQQIVNGKYSFDSPAWESVSNDAKSFVTKLLQFNPSLRYTAEQALKDDWLAQFKPFVSESVLRNVLSQLKQVSCMSEFEKLAWLVAARMATSEEINQLRLVFEEVDENHDGEISYTEFKHAMNHMLGCRSKEITKIFHQVDVQHAGSVDYTSFLASLLAAQGGGQLDDDRLVDVFHHLDVDHCGYITHDHLRRILGDKVSNDYIDKLMVEVVASKDGKINYEKFKDALCKKQQQQPQPCDTILRVESMSAST